MNKEEIMQYLNILNERLADKGLFGEIGLYGGAVMCLVLNARESTHDIDAIFQPKTDMNNLVEEMTRDYNLEEGWLNESVKGFISNKNDLLPLMDLSNLSVYAASPEYMFAMKCLSCRLDSGRDVDDIKFLIKHLGIGTREQAENILFKYYPKNRVMQKTYYMLMELLGG